MNHVDCPNRARLAELALGKLSEHQIDELYLHAAECASCESALETLDGLSDNLMAVVRRHLRASSDSEADEWRALTARAEEISSEIFSGADVDTSEEEATHPAGGPDLRNLRIGQYTLLDKLGQGAMGAVYKAQHHKLRRMVALKMLPAHRMRDPAAVTRFDREMEAVGKVDHANIVRATDAGHIDGVHFLAMEYVEGVDFSRLVRDCGPLPLAEACDVIRQAATALEHAHRRGLIHRDVKPSNLMLNEQGQVKLLDLGLARLLQAAPEGRPAIDENVVSDRAGGGQAHFAKSSGAGHAGGGQAHFASQAPQKEPVPEPVPGVDDPTTAGQIIGTRDYMAPEQALNSHDVDARVDIYSLGCTFFKLLAGKAPFEQSGRGNRLAVLQAHATQPAPAIRDVRGDVPHEVAEVLERMLAKRPEDRFAAAEQVAAALERWCAGADLVGMLAAAREGVSFAKMVDGAAPVWAEIVRPAKAAKPTKLELADSSLKTGRGGMWIAAIGVCLVLLAALFGGAFFLVWRSEKLASAPADDRRAAQLAERAADEAGDPEPPVQPAAGAPAPAAPQQPADKTAPPAPASEQQSDAAQEKRFGIRLGGGTQRIELQNTRDLVDLTQPFTAEMWFRGSGSSLDQTLMGTAEADRRAGIGANPFVQYGWKLSYRESVGGIMPPSLQFEHQRYGSIPTPSIPSHFRFHPRSITPGASYRRPGGPRFSNGKRWRYVAISFDGNLLNVCLDGQISVTRSSTFGSIGVGDADAGGDLYLGSRGISVRPSQGLSGEVGAFRLSSGALYSGSDFTPPLKFERDENTLILLDFSRGDGEHVPDLSGNGHHGKLVGGTWAAVPDITRDETTADDSRHPASLRPHLPTRSRP